MTFIKFKDKKAHNEAHRLEIKIRYENLNKLLEKRIEECVTCLGGKGIQIHEAVFMYSPAFLEEFDKQGIVYEIIPLRKVSKHLSDDSKGIFDYLTHYYPERF